MDGDLLGDRAFAGKCSRATTPKPHFDWRSVHRLVKIIGQARGSTQAQAFALGIDQEYRSADLRDVGFNGLDQFVKHGF